MKMASQRFCLRWNNHQSNMLSVFDQLLHAETFTDVTLAVDGQYLKAHKMVLSACSPYFNALFINHPEKHPIVILKDVPYADMKSLLDFMYRGEVSVDQERLTAFLRVAESLRIKGLTEVNDDKPAPADPPPQPPQLQRIQPYLVQQQQQQQQQQTHRHKSGTMGGGSGGSSSGNAAGAGAAAAAAAAGAVGGIGASNNAAAAAAVAAAQLQAQQSLLSSALAAMPKRKRGRPRKLSGSSNGTGNDYDDYDRDGMMNDSEMGDSKFGNDSFSGNDDASDDNQRDSGENGHDLNESRDSQSHTKKSRQGKDNKTQDNEDNSTSVQLVNASPELSQRLFGLTKPSNARTSPSKAALASSPSTLLKALVQQQQQQHQQQQNPSKSQQQQQQQQQQAERKTTSNNETQETSNNLPAVLGLKIRNLHKQQQQQLQQQCSNNSNSLLKQQLRAGLKEIVDLGGNNNSSKTQKTQSNETNFISNNELACSALQSLANAAERQAQAPQPPTASDLQQQFLLHMAANPMIKSSNEFFQRQQQHQQQMLEQQQQQQEIRQREEEIELLIDQNDQKSEPDLMLVDESLGLEYKSPEGIDERNDTTHLTTTSADHQSGGEHVSINSTSNDNGGGGSGCGGGNSSKPGRSVQRRRVRRKAQSSMDDQAEHLTEMSVRGLDLFRYACITEGVYQCTECAKENVQKTFKNKYSFQRHAFLYHEGKHRKVFPCPLCGKEFSRPDKMKNHMKMTHESFVSSKDITNFNPLNYLITAAAAGEMHATLLTHQQQAQQQQQQLDQLEHMSEQQQQQQQQQYNNALAALSVSLEAQHTTIENVVASARNENENIAPPPSSASEMDISAAALLKLQNDIVIKNEIVISPSPSPPPIEISATSSTSNIKAVNNQQSPTQRLEEVK